MAAMNGMSSNWTWDNIVIQSPKGTKKLLRRRLRKPPSIGNEWERKNPRTTRSKGIRLRSPCPRLSDPSWARTTRIWHIHNAYAMWTWQFSFLPTIQKRQRAMSLRSRSMHFLQLLGSEQDRYSTCSGLLPPSRGYFGRLCAPDVDTTTVVQWLVPSLQGSSPRTGIYCLCRCWGHPFQFEPWSIIVRLWSTYQVCNCSCSFRRRNPEAWPSLHTFWRADLTFIVQPACRHPQIQKLYHFLFVRACLERRGLYQNILRRNIAAVRTTASPRMPPSLSTNRPELQPWWWFHAAFSLPERAPHLYVCFIMLDYPG